MSPGREDLVLPIPEGENPKGLWFTLKEGSHYRLRFSIKVSNDIVCGLKYINTVWKTGIRGIFLLRNYYLQNTNIVDLYVQLVTIFEIYNS